LNRKSFSDNLKSPDRKNAPPKAVSARVSGRVQGVGFRYSAYHQARSLGLSGWVRNLQDGSVELFFQGPEEKAEAFLSWLRRGPPGARVDTVDYHIVKPVSNPGPFIVTY
jgi:acylphosphatase